VGQAGPDPGALAEVPLVMDDLRVPDGLQVIPRAVGREVVDENDLLVDRDPFYGGQDPVDVLALIVDRDDDGKPDFLPPGYLNSRFSKKMTDKYNNKITYMKP